MKELDTVVLRREIPGDGLEAGDVGAIVLCRGDASYEVEFVSGEGGTSALEAIRRKILGGPPSECGIAEEDGVQNAPPQPRVTCLRPHQPL